MLRSFFKGIHTLYIIIVERIYRFGIRRKIKNKDFTIISNDCWGGRVYQDLGIEYNSPTVNLFIYSNCYIKLLGNLKEYFDTELTFKKTSDYKEANLKRHENQTFYPIGVLNDVEIHFLHYGDEQEAKLKWDNRIGRVNYNNLYVKFSDAYLNDSKDLIKFDAIPLKYKVCFVAKRYPGLTSMILMKAFVDNGYVKDPYRFRWEYRRCFDAIKWLNN